MLRAARIEAIEAAPVAPAATTPPAPDPPVALTCVQEKKRIMAGIAMMARNITITPVITVAKSWPSPIMVKPIA
jgi:hypothetical protein